jgi:hypothetical protein
VDQLHHDPWTAVLLDDVMDGDHARVVEHGGGAGLAEHAVIKQHALADPQLSGQGHLFDRDVPVEHFVVGPPHGAHTAPADHGE